ncbi:MAG: aldehyde dehydrogenase family protein [Fuerstiella sp.]
MICHFIDGTRRPSKSNHTFDVRNPEDDSITDQCAAATDDDIDAAIQSAQAAFRSHRQSSAIDRQRILLAAANLMQERSEDFEEALIRETGSPIQKARREIETSIRLFKTASSAAKQMTGQTFQSDDPNRFSFSVRMPIGVVAGFTPFNVPLIKSVKLAAMVLATGNTLVLMPSEQAPTVSILLAQLLTECGAASGCCNVVCGVASEVADHLTTHPAVKFVSFTGSTKVGSHVAALCGRQRKRVTLEMGGQNPLILLKDADLKFALKAAVPGAFLYQGQICMASSRMIVHDTLATEFATSLSSIASSLSLGDLHDPSTMIGPVISSASRLRLQGLIDDAVSKNAVIETGAEWQGNRLLPTVLTHVTDDMKIWQEEVFGPIALIRTVTSSQQALEMANESRYGLSASVFTNDLNEALAFSRNLECGMVHINEGTILEEAEVPFGGLKDSGFGREGVMSAIDDLTEWKWVTWRDSPSEGSSSVSD